MATRNKRVRKRLTPEQIAARQAAESMGQGPARPDRTVDATRLPVGPQLAKVGTLTNASHVDPDLAATQAVAASSPTQGADHAGDVYVFVHDNGPVDADARRAALEAMRPEGPMREVAAVKATVIDLIERVPYSSGESDKSLMTIGVSFARWCHNNSADGSFDPDRDLTEFALNDFLTFEKDGVSENTKSTYASQIRRLARKSPPRRRGTRKTAAPPYSNKVRDRMWAAACDMDDWAAVETRTLLALTFGAGCRGDEVHDAKAGQVHSVGRRVVVRIVREGHWVREVPAYGQYARWLEQRSRELNPDDYLFRPTFLTRRNATSSLVSRMGKRSSVFAGFKSTRARHTWLAQALQAGVPFHAVCQVAGVGRDSNLPSDLLPHMRHLTMLESQRLFDQVFATTRAAS